MRRRRGVEVSRLLRAKEVVEENLRLNRFTTLFFSSLPIRSSSWELRVGGRLVFFCDRESSSGVGLAIMEGAGRGAMVVDVSIVGWMDEGEKAA